MKMSMKNLIVLPIALAVMLFSSCNKEELDSTLSLNIAGLENLGDDFVYEGWVILDGTPVTTGVFTVNDSGIMSETEFDLGSTDIATASKFVLTIEPAQDSDPAPSDVHLVAGDFASNSATLSIGDVAALNADFTDSKGGYILATPTNADDSDEKSGIWFLDPALGPGPALELPTLPAGWEYEGWIVTNGVPVTTGKFTSVSGADDASPFSGELGGPPFPGEDFLVNAPADLTFPLDLAGETAVISIEPVPDNSPNPFLLKPLVGVIPTDALDHSFYSMENNNVYPTGTASIK